MLIRRSPQPANRLPLSPVSPFASVIRLFTLGARGFFLVGGDRIERRSREGESRSSTTRFDAKTSGIQNSKVSSSVSRSKNFFLSSLGACSQVRISLLQN